MRLLLSNDDGILAPGLAALYEAVADMGEVTVVAPSSPQSAAGHSITLRQPLVLQHVQVSGVRPFWANSVGGRPADCVRLAIRKLLPGPPDVVLSGINAGANVGVNVFYSGTVAAAAEAAMLGIPAVAFSAAAPPGPDPAERIDYRRAARLARWVLDGLLRHGLAGGDLINVNFPVPPADAPPGPGDALRAGRSAAAPVRPTGIRVVPQSKAELEDVYHHQIDAQGRETYRLGDDYAFRGHHRDTDVACLEEGFITITPLQVDMTDRRRLEELAGAVWPPKPGSDAAG